VWVNFDGERWWGSWQDESSSLDFHSPNESEVMQWAREQPAAARLRFVRDTNDYVPF
jgi:hypothetical protein